MPVVIDEKMVIIQDIEDNVKKIAEFINNNNEVETLEYTDVTQNIKNQTVNFYGRKCGNVVTIGFSFVKSDNQEASFKIPHAPATNFNFACSSNSGSNWVIGGIRPDGTVYVLSNNNSEIGIYGSVSFIVE